MEMNYYRNSLKENPIEIKGDESKEGEEEQRSADDGREEAYIQL